jgi:predicted kinase
MTYLKCKCCGPKEKPVTTTLTMTKGLPGSGKSTWAKEQVLKAAPGTLIRINKDDLRAMLHAERWHGKNERQVVRTRDALLHTWLVRGISVIVDDTNFNPVHEKNLRDIAEHYGVQFVIKDFTDVPLRTCIKRDLLRERSVGEKVIQRMYDTYLRPRAAPPVYDPSLKDAVLVDIDGTLAKMVSRGPFDWDKVGEDEPISAVINLVNTLDDAGTEIVFLSGRDGSCYEQTRVWLERQVGKWTREAFLYMRAAGDMRRDAVVKEEIYRGKIEPFYNVRFVLDDRDQVVDMWRNNLGLTCLQVAPGDF